MLIEARDKTCELNFTRFRNSKSRRLPTTKPPSRNLTEPKIDKTDQDLSFDLVEQYLSEVGQYKLLTPKEEKELAQTSRKGQAAWWYLVLLTSLGEVSQEEKNQIQSFLKSSQNLIDRNTFVWEGYRIQPQLGKDLIEEKFDAILAGQEAAKKIVESNLRLVVSTAKKYKPTYQDISILDLIQEGNKGLMRAAQRFDVNKGYKFSTYAHWRIRQAIERSIQEKARTIRIPTHVQETLGKLKPVIVNLVQENQRLPTDSEIATRANLPLPKVANALHTPETLPFDTLTDDNEELDWQTLIPDQGQNTEEAAEKECLKAEVSQALSTLDSRERKIIELRYGLSDGRARTLEQVGKEFSITRERARQIEQKALQKLHRSPKIQNLAVDYY